MMHHGYSNNLIFSRRAEERLSRMMAFSLSFHLFLIMTIVIVSIISDKKPHRLDASYVTLVTVPKEDVSNQSESRPPVPGGMEREKKNKAERERDRSIISRKEISGKDSTVDAKQKEGLNDWWKKNKESLIASNDTKTQGKLTVPPPTTIPKAREKPSSIEQDKPQAQEKPEGLNDWWKKNKESLIASNDTKTQGKLTVPPPATIPKAQEKASLQETERPQAQDKSEGLNDWWKKNKESAEDGSKKNQAPGKNLQAEDKVALNNPNPGNVGIKVDNLSTGFPPIYFESIKNKIQRYWFPTSNLMVIVAFSIKPSGEVAGLQVEKGSGNSFFDRSAIRAVMDSTPLPPFPEGFKEKDLNVHFTFIGEAVR